MILGKLVRSIFLIAILAVAASPALARVATGTLEGTVLDSRGNALPGATVSIQTSYGDHPHVTHTDANGHFEFAHFAIGQYDLRAYHDGAYSAWSKRVPVHAAKNAPVILRISLK